MVIVKFKNHGISLEVEEGIRLSDCIRKAGLSVETPCNCMGTCGKCRVKVTGELSPLTEEERKFIGDEENIRLSCIARVEGPVEVELLNKKSELKTINRGYSIETSVNSGIKKIKLPELDRKKPVPYIETLDYEVSSADLFNKIAYLDRQGSSEIFGVVHKHKLLDISDGSLNLLGVAVDIGTTGISAYLVDMETGEVLDKVSCLNPQTEFGGDVLSRITFCINNEDGMETLKKSIINKINEIVSELINDDYSIESVYRVVIAANTTMLHLFLGVDPVTIAKAPYRSVFLDKLDIKATDIGIAINKNGLVTLTPSASGYVGGDIISGVVATAFNKKEHGSIFIDIGTNGEIVAISDGKMAATSTAAGPALEGMNISCGCRAENGAIDSFIIDEDYNVRYTTIGNKEPKGICGSGLIDIAAYLVEKEIVLKSGKFNSNPDERIKDRVIDKKFYITDEIYISQKDIRQIQLAKGAIASGVSMLLHEIGILIEDVEEAVIAGAFGYHINPESIKTVGIIPKGFKGKITFVGNSSVEGARLALINEDILEEMTCLKNEVTVLELSTKQAFQEYFVRELSF
jgi:uncharacterized 2Fe-2S/4Fe-4S cluster protein (DUF4445 family)